MRVGFNDVPGTLVRRSGRLRRVKLPQTGRSLAARRAFERSKNAMLPAFSFTKPLLPGLVELQAAMV
jgi:hypothetical protein